MSSEQPSGDTGQDQSAVVATETYDSSSNAMPLLAIAALIVIAVGVRGFSAQLGPLALGLVITIGVAPVQSKLRNRGWPGWAALLASLLVAYSLLVGFVGSLVWAGYEIVNLFTSPEYQNGLSDAQQQLTDWLEGFGVKEQAIDDAIGKVDLSTVVGQLGTALSGVLGIASALGLIALVMFFMLSDAPRLGKRLDDLAAVRPYLDAGIDSFVSRTRSYLVVSTLFGAIVAVLDGVALWLLGVPLVAVWVVLSFVTNYIPNVGFVIGLIPPALVALVVHDANRMIWVIVVYALLNFVIQSLIQPRIVGDNVGLSTTLTFLSLVFWSYVIGPLGAILAVPLSLLAKAILVDINPRLQWLRPLLSLRSADDEPPLFETVQHRQPELAADSVDEAGADAR